MKTLVSRHQTPAPATMRGRARADRTGGNGNGETKSAAAGMTPWLSAWLKKTKNNLIGGEWVPAVSGKTFNVFNP